jgi:TRAP-type C4-dicarboxylate transport system substrate-binding protein
MASASLALACLAFTPIVSQAGVTLKASSQWNEIHAGSQVDLWWAEEISKRTNGEVNIKIFFAGALGKAQENLKLMQDGAIDSAMMSPGYFPAQLPFHAAPNSIPMAFSRVDQVAPFVERVMREVPAFEQEAAANGMKTLFFHHLNPYQLICKEHIKGVADMKGKKMRTWGKALPQAVQAVGGTPVTLFLPEIYEGLSRGTVDCIPFAIDLLVNYKIYEVAKHHHDITIWQGPTNGTWITLAAWNNLTDEQQKIVEEVSFQAMRKDAEVTIQAGKDARGVLEEKGMIFHSFPASEAAKWESLNPDFFGDFIAAMEEKGLGDDARKTIEIWRDIQAL